MHLAISAPELENIHESPWVLRNDAEIERLLGSYSGGHTHHHVFTPTSFAALLDLLSGMPNNTVRVDSVVYSKVEVVGIVRKLN